MGKRRHFDPAAGPRARALAVILDALPPNVVEAVRATPRHSGAYWADWFRDWGKPWKVQHSRRYHRRR